MNESAEIRDPVCGQVVDPLRARAVGIFGGVTRYFCSPECRAKFVDPRTPSAASAGPGGVERRWQPASDTPTGGSGEWFDKGVATPPSSPAVERFSDLDRSAAPREESPPSPSLMLEVAAARSPSRWLWVVALLVIGSALLFFGLKR